MKKLKEEYKGTRIEHNGIKYDFRNMNDERLQMIWEKNPQLRYAFEEETYTPIEKKPIDIKKLPKFEEPFETPISNSIGEKWTEETFDKAVKDYISDGDKIKPVPPKYKKPSSIPKPKTNEIKKK